MCNEIEVHILFYCKLFSYFTYKQLKIVLNNRLLSYAKTDRSFGKFHFGIRFFMKECFQRDKN